MLHDFVTAEQPHTVSGQSTPEYTSKQNKYERKYVRSVTTISNLRSALTF